MENEELLRRFLDKREQCEKNCCVTMTHFLTPAEQYALNAYARRAGFENWILAGGGKDTERKVGFFLPFYIDRESFDPGEYIRAVEVTTRFSSPGHRDYMGAVLGLGIKREYLGDIQVDGEKGWIFCLDSVADYIVLNLDKIGRGGAKAAVVPLSQVPQPKRQVAQRGFTVMSARLDAVVAGMFGLSRTDALEKIHAGLVQLNYSVCLKPDAPISQGDVLSARGYGKGEVSQIGGNTKKGRTIVQAQIYK